MAKQPKQMKLASSLLFSVRFWCEEVEGNQKEWRGQVEQVLTGEIGYFRDWPTLISFLEKTLTEQEMDALSR